MEKLSVVSDRRSSNAPTLREMTEAEKKRIFEQIQKKHPDADWEKFLLSTKDIRVEDKPTQDIEDAEIVPEAVQERNNVSKEDPRQAWKKKGRQITFIDVAKGKVGERVQLPDGTVYEKDPQGRLRLVTPKRKT